MQTKFVIWQKFVFFSYLMCKFQIQKFTLDDVKFVTNTELAGEANWYMK